MIASLAALSPHLRERLANALEVGLLPSGCSATAVRSVLDLRTGSVEVHAGLSELENLGISGGAAAAWPKALDHLRASPRVRSNWWYATGECTSRVIGEGPG